jgi:excisionase family DNA binding protein
MPAPKPAQSGTWQTNSGAESPAALKIPAAADYLSVSVRTVSDLMRAGHLAAVRIGPRNGSVRIMRTELDRYLAEAQAWEPAS